MKNKVQTTDFLDGYEQALVTKMIQLSKQNYYWLEGGYEEAQRKVLFFYPEKLQEVLQKEPKTKSEIIAQTIKVISIVLPQELQGKYNHSDYLGGIMKLGIKREKIGDIIVNQEGADIIVQKDMASYLQTQIQELTRFQKANITVKELEQLKIEQTKKEPMTILIPQMRLDVIVSEILHLSRNKANEIISQERVFVNYELKTKNAAMLKTGDTLTIRGKGKYEIGEIESQTAKGKLRLKIEKYSS